MPSADTRVFDAHSDSVLSDVRRFVSDAGYGLGSEAIQDLQLAVTEACANAIVHSGTKEIRVTISEDQGCIVILVEDDGIYQTTLAPLEGDAQGHRGLHLMTAMVDQLSVRRGTRYLPGTVVRLVKCSTS